MRLSAAVLIVCLAVLGHPLGAGAWGSSTAARPAADPPAPEVHVPPPAEAAAVSTGTGTTPLSPAELAARFALPSAAAQPPLPPLPAPAPPRRPGEDCASTSNGRGPLLKLVMILKNEADSITPTLASIAPFIDEYTILDTGSTDGTPELVHAALAGIPGTVFSHAYEGLAISRNRAIAAAGTTARYLMFLDANDILEGGDQLRAALCSNDHSVYSLTRRWVFTASDDATEGTVWNQRWVGVHTPGLGWHYEGNVHDVLMSPQGVQSGVAHINGPVVAQIRTPSQEKRSQIRLRSEGIAFLIDEIPLDAYRGREGRAHFYIAQSYVAIGDEENATLWYERRVAMHWGANPAEVYVSRVQLAKLCHARLGNAGLTECLAHCNAAMANNPARPDALVIAAWLLLAADQKALAMHMARAVLLLAHYHSDWLIANTQLAVCEAPALVAMQAGSCLPRRTASALSSGLPDSSDEARVQLTPSELARMRGAVNPASELYCAVTNFREVVAAYLEGC